MGGGELEGGTPPPARPTLGHAVSLGSQRNHEKKKIIVIIMKSTLKVHNPRVKILLICINDVQGKELSF